MGTHFFWLVVMWRNFSHVFGRALRETGQSLERVAYRANDIEVYKTFGR